MPDSLSPFDLAMLDALGEASPEQREALRAACESDPDVAAEHRKLVGQVRILDATLAQKPGGAPEIGAMPEGLRDRLATERQAVQAERRKNAPAAEHGKTVPLPASVEERAELEKRGAGKRVAPQKPQSWIHGFAIAAAVLLFAGVGALWIWRPAPRPAAVALSPGLETSVTNPTLVWENAPGQLYDVWVLPPGGPVETTPAIFAASGVTSPAPFSKLTPKSAAKALDEGQDYRLLICLAGTNRIGGVAVPFRVSQSAKASAFKPKTAQLALR